VVAGDVTVMCAVRPFAQAASHANVEAEQLRALREQGTSQS